MLLSILQCTGCLSAEMIWPWNISGADAGKAGAGRLWSRIFGKVTLPELLLPKLRPQMKLSAQCQTPLKRHP